MKKAIVIGCPGSGKTTFSEKLHKCTGLPLFYLDSMWHKPDKTHISREEFDQRLAEIGELEEWIIDGDYSRTIEVRLKMCDTVFLFVLPTIYELMDKYKEGRKIIIFHSREQADEYLEQL